MPQMTDTVLLRGGLNLVTPPIATPAGQVTAAINYEPEVAGYRRIAGYERFDGQQAPSTGSTSNEMETLRDAIEKVPGVGPVRGVHVYNGAVYAFRDKVSGGGAMYKSSDDGWVEQTFGYTLDFVSGTAAFSEQDTLTGGTSGATATIERVVLTSGSFSDGDAAGFFVLSNLSGEFQASETITSASGSATNGAAPEQPITLPSGGRYKFLNHNFYGAAKSARMYFANGTGTAFEWDGEVLAPIKTGSNAGGSPDAIEYLLETGGDNILTADGDKIIISRGELDTPNYIAEFHNHLFLGFAAGVIVNSGIGEPLDYRAIAGASSFSFGESLTGMQAVSTALILMGRGRISYIAGNDSSDFQMLPVSPTAGGITHTVQALGETVIYLDDAGVRKLSSSAAFGDFRLGTLTQAVEPLFRRKRANGVKALASLVVKAKDQYRLFFDDRTGIVVYLGRKDPETMPFLYPIDVFCTCSGEIVQGQGDRYFVGAEDGYVYELDSGTSFDGDEVQAYIRMAWNNVRAATQEKRFHKATVEIDSEDDIDVGVTFAVDYGRPGNPGGSQQDIEVEAGSQSVISIDHYDDIDWTQPVEGILEAYVDGIGRNLALTLITEHTTEKPHTLSSLTVNFSPRRFMR